MIRQIAEGGFSTVDLVEECETGKKFALKRILCHSIEDQNVALQVCRVFLAMEMRRLNKFLTGGSSNEGAVPSEHCEGSGGKHEGPGGHSPQPHQ